MFKFADITSVYKKGSRFEKNNYRPVNILPVLSKVFEKCLCKQISSYFDDIFSKYQCGFRKGFGAQHCLIAIIEKWRDSKDKGKFFGTILTDLSKAFDCLPHDLLAAKLSAYGFDNNSTKYIGTLQIENSKCEKLLGVNIDSKLSFEKHLNIIFGKARAKISALGRVAPFMNIEKRKMIMNAFFISQFSYCPLIWMFHNRLINNKINRLHERCLRIVYNDNQSTFEELLEKDNTVSVHQRNLQFLAIELYKVINGISPDLMKEVFFWLILVITCAIREHLNLGVLNL